jgi:hypothetical protein
MRYCKKLNEILNVEDDEIEFIDDEDNYEPLNCKGVMIGELNPMNNPLVRESHAIRMKELGKDIEWKSKLMMAIRTEEYRQKMREIKTGTKHSEESKKKMSESAKRIGTGKFNLGVAKTDEHKENMKNAALKRERIPCCKCGRGFTKANLQKHENSCSEKS